MPKISIEQLPKSAEDTDNFALQELANKNYFEMGADSPLDQFKKDYVYRGFTCNNESLNDLAPLLKEADEKAHEDIIIHKLKHVFTTSEEKAKQIIAANTQGIGAVLISTLQAATMHTGIVVGYQDDKKKNTSCQVNIYQDDKGNFHAVYNATGYTVLDIATSKISYLGPAAAHYKLDKKDIKIEKNGQVTILQNADGFQLEYIETDDPIIIKALEGKTFINKSDALKQTLNEKQLFAAQALKKLEEQLKTTPDYLKQDIQTVISEGKKLLQSNNSAELQSLTRCLNATTETLKNPTVESANKLYNLAQTEAKGKPSAWKKFIGGCVAAAGITLIVLGVVGMVATFGSSLGLAAAGATILSYGGYAMGGAFVLGGAAGMFNGRQKGLSKGMDQIADKVIDAHEQNHWKNRLS